MKMNKLIVIILVLLSLLLSALGSAYYFYTKHQKALQTTNVLKTVYVASVNIKKNTVITKSKLKQVKIAKKYLLATPLLEKEIVGKVAKEHILENEIFRKEKLSKKIDSGEADLMKFAKNSYNIDFKLFSNPNFSLNRGDVINIISAYPKSKDRDNMDFKVQYVAKNIKVLGFLEEGKSVRNTFRIVKKRVEKKNKKDKTVRYENVTVFADELVLDIQSKTILELVEDYNKGKQLWMVKTKETKEELTEVFKPVKKDPLKQDAAKKTTIVKKIKPKVYKVQWYKPKNTTYTQVATIRYADSQKVTNSDKVVFENNIADQCRDRSKLLLGVSKAVYLREKPSMKSKVVRKVSKNYLLPYTSKVNKNWYEICDGTFVHTNEANEISYKGALKKLSWKQESKK